ncbi:MAG: heme-binding protein [Pseudomonadota bacterium]
MKKTLMLATSVMSLLFVDRALAQTILPNPSAAEAAAPRPQRARGIPTALAIEAAEAATTTCHVNGYNVTAVVIDSEGVPIALISGDGAAAITQRIAMGKALISLKTKMSSGEAAAKAKADSGFNAILTADPTLGVPRQGGITIAAGADIIGAIAVSGAPAGDRDEVCARAGLSKISDRVR